MSDTIGGRIEAALKNKNGGNQSELARAVGVSPQAVQQWISGDTTPRGKRLDKIAAFLEVSPQYLQFGDPTPPRAATLPPRPDISSIPQFDAGGAMGHGLVLPDQPGVIENWQVSREWLRLNVPHCTSYDNLCIVTGFGPSMRPMFNPGDPLLCDRGIRTVNADGVFFFRIGDEGFIKQLQKIPTPRGMIYRAKSMNPAYDPFDITPDMDFEVLARVIRVWCGTDF